MTLGEDPKKNRVFFYPKSSHLFIGFSIINTFGTIFFQWVEIITNRCAMGVSSHPAVGIEEIEARNFEHQKRSNWVDLSWCQPKNRGGKTPPNHPFVHRVFHYFHHPFWGVYHPYFWKHPSLGSLGDIHLSLSMGFIGFTLPKTEKWWALEEDVFLSNAWLSSRSFFEGV